MKQYLEPTVGASKNSDKAGTGQGGGTIYEGGNTAER